MENINIINFATELTNLTGCHIGSDHIYPSKDGRYYYIQPPKVGAPMLLHHYRGTFFVDIHPDDYKDIAYGRVSVRDFITSANWQVGYYWGGGSMIGGGYYQPLDLVGCRDEVHRYLQILSCRGYSQSCGYMPSEKECSQCFVENCPFSKYKGGNWNTEIQEPDSRLELFKALRRRFEKENPGYSLSGFICGSVPDGEIWIRPNGHYSFLAKASMSVIQSLLMHEIVPEDWDEYADEFDFRIHKLFNSQTFEVTPETLEKAFEGLDYTQNAKTTGHDDEGIYEKKVPLLMRVANFFKKML